MFSITSRFCLLRKMKVWPCAGEVSRNVTICCFGPVCGCMVSGQKLSQDAELGLMEMEKSAPHWTVFSWLTEAGLSENAEPANRVSEANRFTCIIPLPTSYQQSLQRCDLSGVPGKWFGDLSPTLKPLGWLEVGNTNIGATGLFFMLAHINSRYWTLNTELIV